ncbi:MAG: PHP domain-containing protein [Pseudomonadota bacterium]|nr:PHP domain-containing protein [Pseudomonadota bacterium]
MRPDRRPKFYRFDALTDALLSRDFQVHTLWTDGKGTVREVLQKASDRKVREIAFTEHARHTSTYYPEFFAEIDREAEDFPDLTVYRGFEVKITDFDGNLDISDDMRAKAEIILASVHSFPLRDGSGVISPKTVGAAEATRTERDLSLGAIRAGKGDVMSHPGGMSMRFHGGFPLEYYEELLDAIRHTDMAFEFNHSYHAPILPELVALVRQYNPLVSIGSDVHDLDTMGRCRDALQDLLRK